MVGERYKFFCNEPLGEQTPPAERGGDGDCALSCVFRASEREREEGRREKEEARRAEAAARKIADEDDWSNALSASHATAWCLGWVGG